MGIAQYQANEVIRSRFFDEVGRPIQGATNLEEAIVQSGLDYEVQKLPVFFNPRIGKTPKMTKVPDRFVVYRTDNHTPMGVVGKKYEILQNREAFNFLDSLIAGGAMFETAGTYGLNGAKSFITISTEKIKVLDDDIQPFILLTNSFDGTGTVKVSFCPIRIWCSNKLALASRKIKAMKLNSLSIRHTKSMKIAMEQGKEILFQNTQYLETLKSISELLAVTPFSEEAFKKMCEVFYPINDKQSKKAVTMNTEMLEELFRAYKAEDIQNFNNSALKAFQAVADFESHKTSQRSTERENERGLVMAVNGMPILTQALEYVMDQTGVKF